MALLFYFKTQNVCYQLKSEQKDISFKVDSLNYTSLKFNYPASIQFRAIPDTEEM